MLKWIYEITALVYEVVIDFLRYLRRKWLVAVLFGIFVIGLLLFMVHILGYQMRDLVANIIAGFVSMPIVYFVLRFFYLYSPEDRKRLMSDLQQCVDFYKDFGLDFIEYRGKKYPSIVLYRPNNLFSLRDFKVDVVDQPYILPDAIRSFYEPIEDELKKRFLREGYYNAPKARMIAFFVSEDTREIRITIQKTYYYYSFITNFFADYPLYNKKITLRMIYKDEFVRNLKHLDKDQTSNHLGFGGLVITRDGKIPLFLRKSSVAVSSRMLSNTFNGSVDWYGSESLQRSVIKEIKEEVGLDVKEEDLILMGIERNILWLGKTDIHFLYIASGDDWKSLTAKIKSSRAREENLKAIVIDLHTQINSLNDLIKNKEQIKKCLYKSLKNLSSKYQFTISLITSFYFFENFLVNIKLPKN